MIIFSFTKSSTGSILLPVLSILMMFTIITLYIVQDYRSRHEMLTNTKDFYLAKTMEEMAISEFKVDMKQDEKLFQYNIGTVEIKKNSKNDICEIKTNLNNQYKRTTKRIIKE